MGVTIPTAYDVDVDVGSLAPVTVTKVGAVGPVTVDGIPDTYHIDVQHLPKIQIGLDPVTLTVNPVDVGIRLEKIPDIRGHLPADFSVGLSLLGVELACVRLCGEAQVITEPYRPNPCEACGGERAAEPPPAIRPVRPARR
jgi:hypothetical protein